MTELSKAKTARVLVNNPDRYDEFRSDYESDFLYFKSIRDASKKELNFDEYIKFHEIFIQKEPENNVREAVEEWLPRTLKNFVLEPNCEYPVDTLSELRSRMSEYSDLGVSTPTLHDQVGTIIEFLLESDYGPHERMEIITKLLSDIPEDYACIRRCVALLIAVRLDIGLSESGNSTRFLENSVVKFVEVSEDPLSKETGNGEDLVAEAEQLPYSDEMRVSLYCSAVHRTQDTEYFLKYLYHEAREYVEEYRHAGEDPSRGQLLGARCQLNILDRGTINLGDEYMAWVNSYRHVINGILASGASYISDRDRRNLPGSDYEKAAEYYMKASDHIKQYQSDRALKYMSKSYRHLRNSVPSARNGEKLAIHEAARDSILSVVENCSLSEEERSTAQELILFHKMNGQEQRIKKNFFEGEHSRVVDIYHDYAETFSKVDDTSYLHAELGEIDSWCTASRGRIAEEERDFEKAIYCFESTNRVSKDRVKLAHVKKHIHGGDQEEALYRAKDIEKYVPLIVATVSSLRGDHMYAEMGKSHELRLIDDAKLRVLEKLLKMHNDIGGRGDLQDALKECLLNI